MVLSIRALAVSRFKKCIDYVSVIHIYPDIYHIVFLRFVSKVFDGLLSTVTFLLGS